MLINATKTIMPTTLPPAFLDATRQLFGDERFQRYLQSFDEEPPVSIRLNPLKAEGMVAVDGKPVPWCRDAYYLATRPNFTMDPLFHAGCYYVQEAASMFLDEVLRQTVNTKPSSQRHTLLQQRTVNCKPSLDLCAAPGGKSTLLRSALPQDCVLYSNEPVPQRASILLENVEKWGYPNHIVTNNYPRDYRAAKMSFDLILCDVPCSGEGMFRKDPATIREWSPQQVEKCWRLQRQIVDDAWHMLHPGGLLVYSTCTFNTKENEENIRYFLDTYPDMEAVPVAIQPEWHITGSLLAGFDAPVYRFIPGVTRSEGLFLCALRKQGTPTKPIKPIKPIPPIKVLTPLLHQTSDIIHQTSSLPYPQAMAYLRREALVLAPDTPLGIVTVSFHGHPLGPVKNIGSRANNLYPKEWKIKTTHIPETYTPIIE